MDVDMDMSDDGEIAHGKSVEESSNGLSIDATQPKAGDTIGSELTSTVFEQPVMLVNVTPKLSQVSSASASSGGLKVLTSTTFEACYLIIF